MEMQKFNDRYFKVFKDGDELLAEIAERDTERTIKELPTDRISFWFGNLAEDEKTINLVRYCGGKLLTKTIKEQKMTPALAHTATFKTGEYHGTRLFLGIQLNGPMVFKGISAPAKASLSGRSGVSYGGEMDDFDLNIDGVALASILETTIKANAKKVQVVSVYDKVIGIMSERFCLVPQAELVDNVYSVLLTRYKNAIVKDGYVSNRTTAVNFNLCENIIDNGQEYEIMIKLLNSDNGFSAVRMIPCCRRIISRSSKGTIMSPVYRFDDDEWACNHVGADMSRITEGADTMFLKLRDNVALMATAQNYVLKYPMLYTEGAIAQLNKLSTNKGGTRISKKMEKELLNNLDTFISQGIQTEFTVMDIADRLIDGIPQDVAETTRDSMMKTIMRIIHIKHDEYDKI